MSNAELLRLPSQIKVQSVLLLQLHQSNLVPGRLRDISLVTLAGSRDYLCSAVDGHLLLNGVKGSLFAMLSNKFALIDSKGRNSDARLTSSCCLRHASPLSVRSFDGLVIDALSLHVIHNCAEVEANTGLVQGGASVSTRPEHARKVVLESDGSVHSGRLAMD